jgi:hybrid cluster-associated redox disulfide protein
MKKVITKIKKKTATKKPEIKKELINKNMTFEQLFEKKPEAMNILFDSGLHCIGCHMSVYETIEQGCSAHGMSKKETDEIIKKINAIKSDKK